MYERAAILVVEALYLYGIAGLVFAIAFVTTGVQRIDSQAIGSGVGFRILIFAGAAALWPLLLRRWMSRTSEPPEERNPHR
jgi:membrane protein implicated in regulation of membrane protease activity